MHLHITLFLLIGIGLSQGLPEILLRSTENQVSKSVAPSQWSASSSSSSHPKEDSPSKKYHGQIDFFFPGEGNTVQRSSKGPYNMIDVKATMLGKKDIKPHVDLAGSVTVAVGKEYLDHEMVNGAHIVIRAWVNGMETYLDALGKGKYQHSRTWIIGFDEAKRYKNKKTVTWTIKWNLVEPKTGEEKTVEELEVGQS